VNFPIRNKGRLQNNDKGWEKTGHVHNVWIFEYTRYSSLNHIVSIHHPYDQALAAMGEKKSSPPLNLSPSDAIDSSETITSPLHKMSLQFLCSVSNSGQQSDNVEQMMDTGDSEAYPGARPSSSKGDYLHKLGLMVISIRSRREHHIPSEARLDPASSK